MTTLQTLQTADITPSPRILWVLGQIPFRPWQALAELIDNSLDAFLTLATSRQSASTVWHASAWPLAVVVSAQCNPHGSTRLGKE